MAYKYDIVGSCYDRYAKGNKYREEEVIKIPGVTFNSLKDIDKFTASTTKSDFEIMIKDNYKYKNHFSIRVTNNDGRSFYRTIIFNNKELVDLINSIRKKTIKSPNGPRTVDYITGNNKLLSDLWKDVEELVETKDVGAVNSTFDDNYAFIIRRYIESDSSEVSDDYTMIKDWFREYNVFRKYLTGKDKSFVSNMNVRNSNYERPMEVNTSDVVYRPNDSTNDYGNDKEEGIIYYDDGTYKEDEEFLEEGELEEAYGDNTGRKI